MSFRAPRRVFFDGNEGVIRPVLHPPRPAVRINNNLLPWSSVPDPSRDRVDTFSSTLRRRRNMGELDRRSGLVFMRLATVQRNAENQQQRSLQKNWDQQSFAPNLHLTLPDRSPVYSAQRLLTNEVEPSASRRCLQTAWAKNNALGGQG